MLFISNWGFIRSKKLLGPYSDQYLQKLKSYNRTRYIHKVIFQHLTCANGAMDAIEALSSAKRILAPMLRFNAFPYSIGTKWKVINGIADFSASLSHCARLVTGYKK